MLWSLPLLPALAGLAVFLLRSRSRTLNGVVSCGALALTLVLASAAVAADWNGSLVWSQSLVLSTELPSASAVMALMTPTIALPVLLFAAAHEEREGLHRLSALLLLFVGGMELLVTAADFLTLLIGWEVVGACSWGLIGHKWRDAGNPACGLYAFIATRLGDLGLFLAAMVAFAGTGSFAYTELAGLSGPALTIVAFGVLLSASTKAGQLPFAPWLFRAMAGPTPVSALLHSATMVAAGAFLLIRLHPYLGDVTGFSSAAIAVGLGTALAGGVVALLQPHAKKLLAASTSAHFGLMFVAVGAGYPGIALLHLVAHAAFKALLFLAAGVAAGRAGTHALRHMRLGRAVPLTASLAAIGALALAGIPPLGGAWTKEAVTAAAEHHGMWTASGVIIAGALSAAYAMRIQLLAYGPGEEPPPGRRPHRAETIALALLAAMTLALSVLWLPSVHAGLGRVLGIRIVQSTLPALIVSLLLLGFGLLAGVFLARRHPALGTQGPAAEAAEWLGLPLVIDRTLTRPFVRAANAAAGLDHAVFDAVPYGLAHTRLHTAAAGLDRVVFDAVPRALAHAGRRVAGGWARADRKVVDGGIEAAAAFGAWLARMGERFGEALTDGLPEGAARLTGMSGSDARLVQTGMSHHYYALLFGGVLLSIAILAFA